MEPWIAVNVFCLVELCMFCRGKVCLPMLSNNNPFNRSAAALALFMCVLQIFTT